MNVYECTSCGELDVEKPSRVEVVHPDGDVPQWTAWLCRRCYIRSGARGEAIGHWSANGYTWTSADGTTIDIRDLSTKRFPGRAVGSEAEG